jgi:predicted AlkP superfamily pyrophosphatase or phosphodiesterase
MKKFVLIAGIIACVFFFFHARAPLKISPAKPRLVIGIVVDQMRADYIEKYWSKFGEGGFKRLVQKGFWCKNDHYNYVPTYTGPGHASVFTGATPCAHGIIANNWYVRETGKYIYCVDDSTVKGVGGDAAHGKMSPRNLLMNTFGDQLKSGDKDSSKVIGIALKDRGAILPAGHRANAAYWLDNNGNWMSSTYYMKELPQWVKDFNNRGLSKMYNAQPWNTLLPIASYIESASDSNGYEGKFGGEKAPVFPHDIPKLLAANGGQGIIRSTPNGNSLTKDFALQTIRSENLGKRNFTDMLTVSFSSTDYVGHMYGPQSVELEDTYLRLDKDIAQLLDSVDAWLGEKNVLVFLTADHGAGENPNFLKDNGKDGGFINEKVLADTLRGFLFRNFGDSLVSAYINQEIYFNREVIKKKGLDISKINNMVRDRILDIEGTNGSVTREELEGKKYTEGFMKFVQMGFLPARSGDVYVNYKPGWMEWAPRAGTTHGTCYDYDTHVPLIWYGWIIQPGSSDDPVETPDIVATLSALTGVKLPPGASGKPIQSLVK